MDRQDFRGQGKGICRYCANLRETFGRTIRYWLARKTLKPCFQIAWVLVLLRGDLYNNPPTPK